MFKAFITLSSVNFVIERISVCTSTLRFRWESKKSGWGEDGEESVPMLSQDHAGNGWADHDQDDNSEDNSDTADESDDQVLVRGANPDKRNFVNVSIQS